VGPRWVQPARTPDGRLTLHLRGAVPELTGARVDGDHLELTGRIPSRLARPELRLARAAGDVTIPLERRPIPAEPKSRAAPMDEYTARIGFADLIDAVNPDDPFLDRTVLVPRIHDGEDQA